MLSITVSVVWVCMEKNSASSVCTSSTTLPTGAVPKLLRFAELCGLSREVIDMRLVYDKTGVEVKVGDKVTLFDCDGDPTHYTVVRGIKPHKPASSGFVEVKSRRGDSHTFYASVIGATWIEREDRV